MDFRQVQNASSALAKHGLLTESVLVNPNQS